MPFGERTGNQGDRPERGTVKKKGVPARGNNNIVNKETALEKKLTEKECEKEIKQLDVLKRMKKYPSRDKAVYTLLHCENNPSDAELIATSIIKKRMKHASPFRSKHISDNQ
jgi:hypothetical protein